MSVSKIVFILSTILSLDFSAENLKILDHINRDLTCLENTSGFKAIDQIYVLNLDVRYERWVNTQKQFEVLGIYPQRVSGINGWVMDRKKMKAIYRNFIQKPYDKYLTPGQLGCFLSHLSILNNAFQNQYKCIWVMEDDVLVLENPRELDTIVSSIKKLDPEWDVLFTDENSKGNSIDESWTIETFSGNNFNYSLVRDPKFSPLENEEFKRIEYRLGTHSMIISDRGIKKLLDYFQSIKISFPIDIQMHCCPNKHFYVSKKEYVTNDKRNTSDTSVKPGL